MTPGLVELYQGFEKALLVPLWTEIGDLMPLSPKTKAQPHRWQWKMLLELAAENVSAARATTLALRRSL